MLTYRFVNKKCQFSFWMIPYIKALEIILWNFISIRIRMRLHNSFISNMQWPQTDTINITYLHKEYQSYSSVCNCNSIKDINIICETEEGWSCEYNYKSLKTKYIHMYITMRTNLPKTLDQIYTKIWANLLNI